jgi:hypothetical protein
MFFCIQKKMVTEVNKKKSRIGSHTFNSAQTTTANPGEALTFLIFVPHGHVTNPLFHTLQILVKDVLGSSSVPAGKVTSSTRHLRDKACFDFLDDLL